MRRRLRLVAITVSLFMLVPKRLTAVFAEILEIAM
jgi:hypothetical protein